LKPILRIATCLFFDAALARGGVSYTCDPNINATVAGLCNTLNTTTAALYNNTFSNVNASIYIMFGSTGLGSNSGIENLVPYSTYVTAATMYAGGSAVQTAAAAGLKSYAQPVYGNNMVSV